MDTSNQVTVTRLITDRYKIKFTITNNIKSDDCQNFACRKLLGREIHQVTTFMVFN